MQLNKRLNTLLFSRMSTLILISMTLFSCVPTQIENEGNGLETRTVKRLTTDFILNSNNLSQEVAVNQVITINQTQDEMKWKMSVGKRDFKHAVIDKYENNSQKSIRFTKIGTYQVKLSSHRSKAQGAIMLQNMTIIVK